MNTNDINGNPDVLMGCVDAETEVLTPYGFWRFNRIQKNNKIYVWKEGVLEINTVSGVFTKEYDGIMHMYKKNWYNQLITPDHRMISKKENANNYIIKQSSEIFKNKSTYELPNVLTGSLIADVDIDDEKIIRYSKKSQFPMQYGHMSLRQAKLFIDNWPTVVKRPNCDTAYFCQTAEKASMLQHVMVLAGRLSYLAFSASNCYVIVRESESIIPDEKGEVEYKGIIWSPCSRVKTAIYRRHGNIFISGQTSAIV